jgi:hypothetical protein
MSIKLLSGSMMLLILSLFISSPVMAAEEELPRMNPESMETAPASPSAPAEEAVEAPAPDAPPASPEEEEPAVQSDDESAVTPSPIEKDATGLHVEKMVICIDIQDREPVGEGTIFPATTGQVYCHSRILGAEAETTIHHVWYWNDQKMADVPLTVRSRSYRTHSSKKILPQWKGSWRVELTGPDGEILDTAAFNIE